MRTKDIERSARSEASNSTSIALPCLLPWLRCARIARKPTLSLIIATNAIQQHNEYPRNLLEMSRLRWKYIVYSQQVMIFHMKEKMFFYFSD